MLTTPTLFIMCGLSFSGKTTLARRISQATGAVIVSYDRLFTEVDRGPEITGLDEWYMIVALVQQETRRHLASGQSVIVDNLNEDVVDRDQLRAIANEEGALSLVVYVDAPLDVIADRHRRNEVTMQRGLTTDDEFRFVLSRFQPPAEPEDYVRFVAGEDVDK
jgi:predicted kinase